MAQRIKRPYLSYETLREACIKNGWFGSGSNDQYEKLFALNQAGANSRELALCIWLCSSNDTLERIQQVLQYIHGTTSR